MSEDNNKPIDKPEPKQLMTVSDLIKVFQQLEEESSQVRISIPLDPISAPVSSSNISSSSSTNPTPTTVRSLSPEPASNIQRIPVPIPVPVPIQGENNDDWMGQFDEFIIIAFCLGTYAISIILCYLFTQ